MTSDAQIFGWRVSDEGIVLTIWINDATGPADLTYDLLVPTAVLGLWVGAQADLG